MVGLQKNVFKEDVSMAAVYFDMEKCGLTETSILHIKFST